MRQPVFFLIACLLMIPAAAPCHEVLVLGIHPYKPNNVLQKNFRPLADYVQEALGYAVEIRVGTNYQDHLHAISSGAVDLAFLGPAGYVNLTKLFGEHPLLGKIVTNGEPVFRGHIVVAENSSLTSLKELGGKRLAFVNLFSTMYLVPYAMLKQAGLKVEDLSGQAFLNSHQNVALGILAGDFAAGAVKEEVFLKFTDRGLRSLVPTMEIPEHVFVANSRLDPELIAAASTALMNLKSTEIGVKILQSIKSSCTAVVAAEDADYDPLRDLLKYLDKDLE
ncbi:MAG: phosphate/phosphite/phosphonate ABC transporter substrate-binding protein [Gemmatimonadales bacterium]|nr:phosphate/phosphite/phosphonate ABC transporter substrate-binding protein [Gemmatimonadales bacterium]